MTTKAWINGKHIARTAVHPLVALFNDGGHFPVDTMCGKTVCVHACATEQELATCQSCITNVVVEFYDTDPIKTITLN